MDKVQNHTFQTKKNQGIKSKDPVLKKEKVVVSAGYGWHQKLLGREYGFGMKGKWYGMEVTMVATVGITRTAP